MTISGVNSSSTLQMLLLLQQQAKAATDDAHAANASDLAGQNVPDATTQVGTNDQTATDGPPSLDPALSPEAISQLLLQLQAQEASLDTTLLLGGGNPGAGGNTLLDYLNGNTGPSSTGDPLLDPLTNIGATSATAATQAPAPDPSGDMTVEEAQQLDELLRELEG